MISGRRAPRRASGKQVPRGRRPLRGVDDAVRDTIVRVQYEDAAAAASYAASHEGWGPSARYFHSRLHVVLQALGRCSGGDLIDIGCGPGMLLRRLLDTRPGDFHITALDRSTAMIQAASTRVKNSSDVHLTRGSADDAPFPDKSFDVVVAMGVLEYCEAARALREFRFRRLARPGGHVLVTMLNPLSPYRLFEWFMYWPALRVLGCVERLLGRPANRRHGARASGIRAIPAPRLRRMMQQAGLRPDQVVYYDLSPLVPPVDRIVRRWFRQWREHPEKTATGGIRGWIGTAYLVVAHRTGGE